MKGLSSYFRQKFGRGKAEIEARKISGTAHEFFGGDFPNPRRVGCPPNELLRQPIDGKELPGDDLRNHLFGCSECFNEYQILLRQTKFVEVSKKNAFHFQRNFVLAGSLAVILIALGCLFWFWREDYSSQTAGNEHLKVEQNSNANVETTANDETFENAKTNSESTIERQPLIAEENQANAAQNIPTNHNINKRQSIVKETEPRLLAKNEVKIDLNEPVWRDSANGNTNQKIVRLDAKETLLHVKLPRENPAGVYQVYFVDEFGKTLTEKKSVQAVNQTLSVEFDLRKINGSKKRLCFAPVGEIPDCVLVNIAPPK